MSQPSMFSDRRLVVALATLCCFLWGSAVPGVKVGYTLIGIAPGDTASLLLFAGVRFLAAGLMLLAYAGLSGRKVMLAPRRLAAVTLLGLTSTALQYLFCYIGLAHSTGVKVSITTSTSTFFSVLLAHFIYAGDKLTAQRIIGCLLGFAGVIAVNVGGAGFDLNVSLLGEGFIVIAAVMFSIAGIYGKRVSRELDVTVMTGWQLALGGAMLTALGLATGGQFTRFGWDASLLLVYLAALSAAAFALWSQLLKHNRVGAIAIFSTLIPVFGVTLSAVFLGESILELKNLVALVLVCLGIWLVTASHARVVQPV